MSEDYTDLFDANRNWLAVNADSGDPVAQRHRAALIEKIRPLLERDAASIRDNGRDASVAGPAARRVATISLVPKS